MGKKFFLLFLEIFKGFLGECSQLLSPSSSQKKTLLEGAIKGEGVEGVSHKKIPGIVFFFFILSGEALTKEGLRQSGEIEEGKEEVEITL